MDLEKIQTKLDLKNQLERYLARGGRHASLVEWDFLNLYAQLRPDKEILSDTWVRSIRRFSFAQILELSNSIIFSLLSLGLKKGDIAFVQLPNVMELWCLRIAFSKLGIIEARIGENYRQKEIQDRMNSLKPVFLVIPDSFKKCDYILLYQEIFKTAHRPEHIFVVGRNIPEGMKSFQELTNRKLGRDFCYNDLDSLIANVNDNFTISFTGGTTGLPKSALQSTFYSAGGAVGMQVIENGNIGPDDKLLALAPLAGGTGSTTCYFAAIYSGASVVLMPQIDVELALQLTEQEKVTIWAGIPTYAIRLLTSPSLSRYNIKSVRLWVGSGARMPIDFAERFHDMGIKTINSYGIVDGSIATRTCINDTRDKMINTAGKSIRGISIKIIDPDGNEVPEGVEGEIVGMAVRGGNIIDAETCDITPLEGVDENGFFHTGDVGFLDEDGYLTVIDRMKDMILRGGQNIFPSEIEGLLLKHPFVADVAVVGMPDKELGEKACAFVVPKQGSDFSFEEMVAFLKSLHTAMYMLPERLEIITSLPLSHGGKHDKKVLKAELTNKLKQEGKI